MHLVTGILPDIDIDHYSDNNSLSSLSALKDKINEEGNLSFLKKDILYFIQQNGYPFIVIVDMKINTSTDNGHDNNKILKTLLLAYIIILQSEKYKDITCNLLILADKKEYDHMKVTHKLPQDILAILKTNDDRLNSIIREYTTNSEKFKRNFNILITDAEQEPSLIKSEFILFANMIKSKEKLRSKFVVDKTISLIGPKIGAAQAADVVLHSGRLMLKNGETPVIYNEELNLAEGEIYILGNFTSFTRLDVIQRLLSLLKSGFENESTSKKGDVLTIHIPKESIIDSTTPITLAQLISKELHDFKIIKIKTTSVHYHLMQQSKGFSMIQRNVIINDA
jgi:hypothetical protein